MHERSANHFYRGSVQENEAVNADEDGRGNAWKEKQA
jgi:hypothetical protein